MTNSADSRTELPRDDDMAYVFDSPDEEEFDADEDDDE